MAEINKETIKTLAYLSRIECTEEEQEALSKDLNKMVGYVSLLDEINTEEVLPCNQVVDLENVFREDERKATLSRDIFLSNTPKSFGGFVVVSPVFKQS